MKLLVDSGATKADWIALDEQGNRLFTTQTLGLSPEVINKEEALERLEARFDIYNNRDVITVLLRCGLWYRQNEIIHEWCFSGVFSKCRSCC
jgi:hypothetical protein